MMTRLAVNRQRFASDREFPPYTHVPGETPHPTHDSEGHSYPGKPRDLEPLDIENWQENEDYLYAIDLFNHGYYWEAHEVWEGLWHAHGREGITAAFLQGLIKLAAAGVKVRQETDSGVRTHASRAGELFERVLQDADSERYAGLHLERLIAFAKTIATGSPEYPWGVQEKVHPVFDEMLPLDAR